MSLSNWSRGAGALLRQRGYACKQNHAATPRQRLCFRHVAEADGLPVRPATMARPEQDSIQKGTRVLISLWDSLMFGQVPNNAAALFGYPPEH